MALTKNTRQKKRKNKENLQEIDGIQILDRKVMTLKTSLIPKLKKMKK